jgi:hypothetical protein
MPSVPRGEELDHDLDVARYVERCRDCTPTTRCRWHVECSAHQDAQIAAKIGAGWARFVWFSIDLRRPWPAFEGDCADIALRLVSWLANDDVRRRLLAEICSWRASITWEALQAGSRDRPFRAPSNSAVEYALPGHEHVVIRFRPRDRGMVVPLVRSALATERERGARFRSAQGVGDDIAHASRWRRRR